MRARRCLIARGGTMPGTRYGRRSRKIKSPPVRAASRGAGHGGHWAPSEQTAGPGYAMRWPAVFKIAAGSAGLPVLPCWISAGEPTDPKVIRAAVPLCAHR